VNDSNEQPGHIAFIREATVYLKVYADKRLIETFHWIGDYLHERQGFILGQRDFDGASAKGQSYDTILQVLAVLHMSGANSQAELDEMWRNVLKAEGAAVEKMALNCYASAPSVFYF
jgi:hypothetical protein